MPWGVRPAASADIPRKQAVVEAEGIRVTLRRAALRPGPNSVLELEVSVENRSKGTLTWLRSASLETTAGEAIRVEAGRKILARKERLDETMFFGLSSSPKGKLTVDALTTEAGATPTASFELVEPLR